MAEAGAVPASEPGGTFPSCEEQQTDFQLILLNPTGSSSSGELLRPKASYMFQAREFKGNIQETFRKKSSPSPPEITDAGQSGKNKNTPEPHQENNITAGAMRKLKY